MPLVSRGLTRKFINFRTSVFGPMIRLVLTRAIAADLGLLLLRVFTGSLLIHHGYEKLANIENFADAFVRPLHLPFPILPVSYTHLTLPTTVIV